MIKNDTIFLNNIQIIINEILLNNTQLFVYFRLVVMMCKLIVPLELFNKLFS